MTRVQVMILNDDMCGGPFHVNGPKLIYYTKAYELVGKGVGIDLVGLYCKPAYAHASHAQYLDSTRTIWQVGCSKCSHSRIIVTVSTTKDTTIERLL